MTGLTYTEGYFPVPHGPLTRWNPNYNAINNQPMPVGPWDNAHYDPNNNWKVSAENGPYAVGEGTSYPIGLTLEEACRFYWTIREFDLQMYVTINCNAPAVNGVTHESSYSAAASTITKSNEMLVSCDIKDCGNWQRTTVDDQHLLLLNPTVLWKELPPYYTPIWNEEGGYWDYTGDPQIWSADGVSYEGDSGYASYNAYTSAGYKIEMGGEMQGFLYGNPIPFWNDKYWFCAPTFISLYATASSSVTEAGPDGTEYNNDQGSQTCTITTQDWIPQTAQEWQTISTISIPFEIQYTETDKVTCNIPAKKVVDTFSEGLTATADITVHKIILKPKKYFTYGGIYNETTGAKV